MSHSQKAAFFDLDGTLTRKDTFLEFLKFEGGQIKFLWCLICLSPYVVRYFLKLLSNSRLKEKFFSFYFKGKAEHEVRSLGDRFALEVLPRLILPEASQLLAQHKDSGYHIFILTASSNIWLELWCKNQGYNLISTQFEISNSIFTGKILGENCYGKEKAIRITPLLQSYDETIGYGDSKADHHFISLLSKGFKVNIDRKNKFSMQEI